MGTPAIRGRNGVADYGLRMIAANRAAALDKVGLDQRRAPYFEALQEYASVPRSVFHTPGHIQGRGSHQRLGELFGPDTLKLDLCTGLGTLDGVHGSALEQAEELAAAAYGDDPATERHRHRYEVNNAYRPQLEAAGLVFSGTSPDGRLVEIAELPKEVHPFFVGTQAHPEFRSRPTRAHPLFRAFVGAAVQHSDGRRLPLQA